MKFIVLVAILFIGIAYAAPSTPVVLEINYFNCKKTIIIIVVAKGILGFSGGPKSF